MYPGVSEFGNGDGRLELEQADYGRLFLSWN